MGSIGSLSIVEREPIRFSKSDDALFGVFFAMSKDQTETFKVVLSVLFSHLPGSVSTT